MKRIFPIFLCVFFLLASFSFVSLAVDVPTINSSMNEPSIYYRVDSSGVHLQGYIYTYDTRGFVPYNYRLFVVTADGPVGSDFVLYCNSAKVYLDCNVSFSYSFAEYDIVSGGMIGSRSGVSSYIGNESWAIVPNGYNYYVPASYFEGSGSNINSVVGYINYPNEVQKLPLKNSSFSQSYSWVVDSFVNWSVSPLDVVHYKSFVSEPVCDDLNRYFVFAGEHHKYLFAVRYHLQEYSSILDTFSNNQFYWIRLINYMIPLVNKDDNNISLSLYCDPQLLSIIDSNSQSTIIHYGITIAQYDLESGQFINSSNYSDLSVGVNEISLNYDFGSVSDYDSAQFWGVYYNDNSSQLHYNLLSCTWALDPDFLFWQSQLIDYLDRIYNVLNQEVEPATTSPQADSFNDSVVDYESHEHNIMGEQGSIANNIDNIIGDWDSDIQSDGINHAFGFIKYFFENFLFSYYSLFFLIPLIFGLIALIIGRRIQR